MITDTHSNTIAQAHPWPTLPQRKTVLLTRADRRHLERYMAEDDQQRSPSPMLAHVIQHKLASAELVDGEVPPELVTGGSIVGYSIDGAPEQSGLMATRARSGVIDGVIPLASLLGATLIGMRTGQRAPLLKDNGTVASVKVTDVAPATARPHNKNGSPSETFYDRRKP